VKCYTECREKQKSPVTKEGAFQKVVKGGDAEKKGDAGGIQRGELSGGGGDGLGDQGSKTKIMKRRGILSRRLKSKERLETGVDREIRGGGKNRMGSMGRGGKPHLRGSGQSGNREKKVSQ